MKTISKQVTPFLFERNLIISLSSEWLSLFDTLPKFEVYVDSNNRIVLKSQPFKEKTK